MQLIIGILHYLYSAGSTESGSLLSSIIPSRKWEMEEIHKKGLTGKGISIAIIDSGVCDDYKLLYDKDMDGWSSFPALSWREELEGDCVPKICQHGTLVSSIIGGFSNTMRFGIAPEADIYVCRVINNDKNEVTEENLFSALQHILHKKNSIDIVCMSVGLKKICPHIATVLEELYKKGVVLVAAAGNEGRFVRTPMFPASDLHVLSVGALDEYDEKANSNPGCGVNMYLPGKHIAFPKVKSSDPFDGSSYAAPMLAGFLSLLMQWAKDNIEDGSEEYLAKYRDVNFLRKVINKRQLSDPGSQMVGMNEFLNTIIERKNVVDLVKEFFF